MEPRTIRTADVMTLDYLTLREVANAAGVSVEVVRQWCIRHRDGKPGGLKYVHFGAAPESEAARTNYRVHVDDWREFKKERRGEEAKEDRQVRQWVEQPISYV
jgi:hypothetical protein